MPSSCVCAASLSYVIRNAVERMPMQTEGRGRGDGGGEISVEELVCASKMAEPAGDVAACFLLFLFSSFYLEFAVLQA